MPRRLALCVYSTDATGALAVTGVRRQQARYPGLARGLGGPAYVCGSVKLHNNLEATAMSNRTDPLAEIEELPSSLTKQAFQDKFFQTSLIAVSVRFNEH